MGRLPRAIDDGLVYHAFNRVNNRAALFADEGDPLAFPQALELTKGRYPFRLFCDSAGSANSFAPRLP